jgi:hypothetical protein
MRAATPACDALSVAELTRLAPEDGSHWLMLAAADAAARAEAVQRAAASSRFGSPPSIVAAVDAAFPADAPPCLRKDLLMDALFIDNMRVLDHSFTVVIGACRQGVLTQAQCAALAGAMESGTDTLAGFVLARALGKLSGWSPERVQASTAQQDRWATALGKAFDTSDHPYGCEAVQRFRGVVLQRAAQGELGVARAFAR